jgi:UDP-N-acetylmuramoylalanine--D-glutamate ligase
VKQHYLIVGLGATGQSCARYLRKQGLIPVLWDTRANPPQRDEIDAAFPDCPRYYGTLPPEIEAQAEILVISPGLPLTTPVIARALAQKKPVIGDIELFAQANPAPVIAITGSDGKSTTVTLVGEMAQACGIKTAVMGNIGEPVLNFIGTDYDLAVMELSSFQLASTYSLQPAVACILNISPDHLDWHGTLEHYIQSKQRIYQRAQRTVCNRDDRATWPAQGMDLSFPMDPKQDPLYEQFDFASLPIQANHYLCNVLAALHIAEALGWDLATCFRVAQAFKGLPHRLQLIPTKDGIAWFNDSKATNEHSAIAAIENVGKTISGKAVLIMGGQAKTEDFSSLRGPVSTYAKHVLLIGEAKNLLMSTLQDLVNCELCEDLPAAVARAKVLANPGDAVILAPACTSWDMFNNYAERGELFMQCVGQGAVS